MTGLGLVLFWLLCTVFVLTAPREGDTDLEETVEVSRHCPRVRYSTKQQTRRRRLVVKHVRYA